MGRFTRTARRSVLPARRDVALAVGLLVAAELEVLLVISEHPPGAVLGALVMNGALAWRRDHPLLAEAVVLAGFAGQVLAGVPQNAQVVVLVTMFVALYSVGAHLSLRPAVVGLLLGWLVPLLLAATEAAAAGDLAFAALVMTAPWVAGRLVREHLTRAENSDTRAALAEARSALRVRSAVDSERARIARELHDIVSNNLSTVAVQAGAAESLLDRDPQGARESLAAIQRVARQALADMSHLLVVLRRGDSDELLENPSLSDLGDLVEQERDLGQVVELELPAEPPTLPRGLELSLYRIAQEALSNVRRHAAGARVHVRLHQEPDGVRLLVTNTGGTTAGPAGSGTGLLGMRERVGLYGGELSAGPEGEGWRVEASFPVEGAWSRA